MCGLGGGCMLHKIYNIKSTHFNSQASTQGDNIYAHTHTTYSVKDCDINIMSSKEYCMAG